ncbi:MAG: hypothetical protein J1F17_04000 [Oscillospiraceae bacterium]|nr:hypothetical protein [Oscillospiraceae bacterium]
MIKKQITKVIGMATALLISASCVLSANAAEISIDKNGKGTEKNSVLIPFKGESTVLPVRASQLPQSYSANALGYVTPVRNQGSTEDCWAFSGTSALETLLAKNGEIEPIADNWFSISHMDAWGSTRRDGTGWQRDYQTGGGYPYITLGYLSSWTGAIKESIYPFQSPLSLFDVNKKYDIDYSVTGMMYLDGNDKETIKKSIMNYGGVVTSFNYLAKFSKDNATNYYCPEQQSNVSGHSIHIVGWDDNYSKDNFKVTMTKAGSIPETVEVTPNNDGAWLCKNSWGENSGNQGYFWISYEDYYLFSVSFGPTYCINEYMQKESFNNIYQVETYGSTYEFTYLNGTKDCTFINVMDFEGKNEVVDKVMFESESVGAEYTIYNIPYDKANNIPDSNQANWEQIATGTVPYSGYICVDTKNFEAKTGKSCIGVNINTKNTDATLGIGSTEWLANKGVSLFNTDAKRGVCYLSYGDTFEDVMDFYLDMLGDDRGGNFVIKAITTKASEFIGDVNLDGKLDITDGVEIQKYVNHSIDFGEQQLKNADFNNDGYIDIKDVTAIQKHLAKIN